MKACSLLHRHVTPLIEKIAVLLWQDPEIPRHAREALRTAITSGAGGASLFNTVLMLHTHGRTGKPERNVL